MPIITESGYPRDTLTEWVAKTSGWYEAAFGVSAKDGVNARLAEIDAQMAHSICGFIEAEAMSFMIQHAKGARLKLWGAGLVGDMKNAGAAHGFVRFTGSDGAVIAAEAVMVADDGMEYVVTASGTVAGGVVDVTVTCTEAGVAGNQAPGAVLTLVNPVLGLDGLSGTVQDPGLTGGVAVETEDEYRARILARLRATLSGGNDLDYQTWALEVPGVTRAWVDVSGEGDVIVRFMMDSTYADGIPVGTGAPAYTGDLKAVYDYIIAKRPSPAPVFVIAPVAVPIAYEITGLDPDTPEIRDAIAAELADAHARRSAPGKVWRWSWGAEAVTTAAGADSFDVISPTTSVVCAAGEIATFGGVTYL